MIACRLRTRRILTWSVLLLLLGCVPVAAQPDPSKGWREAEWGMTPDQILRALSGPGLFKLKKPEPNKIVFPNDPDAKRVNLGSHADIVTFEIPKTLKIDKGHGSIYWRAVYEYHFKGFPDPPSSPAQTVECYFEVYMEADAQTHGLLAVDMPLKNCMYGTTMNMQGLAAGPPRARSTDELMTNLRAFLTSKYGNPIETGEAKTRWSVGPTLIDLQPTKKSPNILVRFSPHKSSKE